MSTKIYTFKNFLKVFSFILCATGQDFWRGLYMFCRYTFCPFIPFVVIRYVFRRLVVICSVVIRFVIEPLNPLTYYHIRISYISYSKLNFMHSVIYNSKEVTSLLFG
jgi:hypothetical protein